MHIWHVMVLEFKNNKNATETAKKICSLYNQSFIMDCQVWNWFSKFCSGDASLIEEPRPGCSSDLNQENWWKCSLHKSTWELAHSNPQSATTWKI